MTNSKVFVLRDDNSLDRVKRGLYNELSNLILENPKQVSITNYKENKTKEQENSFHLLCGALGEITGYTKNEIKELVKQSILGTKIVTVAGRHAEVTRSSTEAKRDEYSQLIEGVYKLASEAGIQLPELRRS